MTRADDLPLSGVKVLDLTQIYQGPYATFLMAKAGAEVVKIEPLDGEPTRIRAKVSGGASLPMAMLNVNKKGITLNLKHEQGKALFKRLVAQADVVITTALIPGRPAPVLVTEDMVKSMKAGSVIVDLAAPQGGNCPLTTPGQTVQRHGVTLVGETNLPALVAADASSLYARNVLDFLKLVLPKAEAGADPGVKIDLEDDIVAACLMTQGGEVKRASK
jgi:alanine dehydrogenase